MEDRAMPAVQRFTKVGWKVLFFPNSVAVRSSEGTEYHVCGKYVGGGNYERELMIAWNHAAEQGLV